jgi:diacylglycerol O-acyltransferase / wax synthase
VRAPDDTGLGNRVAGMTVPLADDEADPAEQLRRIREVTGIAKDRLGAITADLLRNWTEHASPALAVQAFRFYSSLQLTRRHPPVANLTISNVPGPDFPLYVAGSRLEAMYPMGPVIHGQGLNITVVSYLGRMYFGMVGDPQTVPPLPELAEEIPKAASELLEAAGG